ncbi:HIT domain-containing protein [archaeon]|nr:HIT domain-containing protein [archaeon]
MSLKKAEVDSIKQNLLGQIANFPEEKQGAIKEQIDSMTAPQIEEFVKQNELTHMPGGCIFCSIIEGKNPSVKIDENDVAVAILEINPLSRGHALVIPKKHGEKVLVNVMDFAENLKKKMKKILSPKDVTIREIQIMDHALLEVIPIYGTERERSQASQDELIEIQKILTETITGEEMIIDDSDASKIVEEVKIEELKKMPLRMPEFS